MTYTQTVISTFHTFCEVHCIYNSILILSSRVNTDRIWWPVQMSHLSKEHTCNVINWLYYESYLNWESTGKNLL